MALYMWRGKGSAFFLPETIDVAAGGPTTAQIEDPGTLDLTDATTGLSGFETTPNMINVPLLRSRTPAQIVGEETFGNPQLIVVDDDGVDALADLRQTIIDTLVPGVAGTIVFFLTSQDPQTGDRCYWVKVSVGGQTPALSLDAVASTVAINLAAQHALLKGVLNPAGS